MNPQGLNNSPHDYQERYVAFLDLIGFKNLVREQGSPSDLGAEWATRLIMPLSCTSTTGADAHIR